MRIKEMNKYYPITDAQKLTLMVSILHQSTLLLFLMPIEAIWDPIVASIASTGTSSAKL